MASKYKTGSVCDIGCHETWRLLEAQFLECRNQTRIARDAELIPRLDENQLETLPRKLEAGVYTAHTTFVL